MNFYLTRKIEIAILIAIVFFALIFTFSGFLERPALWFDEGINIEIARNFALFGELDILTAPDTFSGMSHLIGTNGYPLTIPLAGVFKIFGVGLLQARIFMLFWLFATIGAIYFVTRKLFGVTSAIVATALTVSFASFYGNGLTATGEMPGLFFFIMGLWLLIDKKYYFGTGLLWGLAMASKPGVFLLLAHTTVLYIIFADRKEWFKKILKAATGFLIPISIWILLVFPFNMGTFYSVITYALNPIEIPIVTSLLERLPEQALPVGVVVRNTESVSENISRNLSLFVTHSTFIYFSILATIVLLGLYWGRVHNKKQKRLFFVILSYGLFTLFFFIRGPGWIRYLIGLQVLLFIPLLPALNEVLLKVWKLVPNIKDGIPYIKRMHIAVTMVLLLVVLQTVQLYVFSDIPNSKATIESVVYLTKRMEKDKTENIGIYNIPEIAAFTDPSRTYHTSLPQAGLPPLGESPLLMENPPEIIFINKSRALIGDKEQKVLDILYKRIHGIQKFHVYEKIL